MGLHFQSSYRNGAAYFRNFRGKKILASREFGYLKKGKIRGKMLLGASKVFYIQLIMAPDITRDRALFHLQGGLRVNFWVGGCTVGTLTSSAAFQNKNKTNKQTNVHSYKTLF